MVKRVIVMALMTTFVSAPAFAQRVEVSGLFGWTLSDGVNGDPVLAGDGNLYDTVDVKDSASWVSRSASTRPTTLKSASSTASR